MGKLLFQYNVRILICWALVMMDIAAKQEYFILDENLTWDAARNHCQICFKELVTLTPENSQLITQRLNFEHWIGLRKNLSSTNNSSMFWSQWANGDPLFFQNWYPGWPVFKSPPPKIDCCSCSCTCPENSSFFYSYDHNMTLKTEAACERSPMPVVPQTNESESYIEDSCVAMLSFGPWVEKSCLELLPFICFEERFLGQVNVTNVTSETATLAWLPAPGDITHYRMKIEGNVEKEYNLSSLTYDVDDLTPGGCYKVQVFPVKCERDLNPQNATFYTVPNKVTDLKVINVTNTSVTLSWNKPIGTFNFYLVTYESQNIKLENGNGTPTVPIKDLIPGHLYRFTVLTGVQDNSRWSEKSNITTNTKPGSVSSLTVSGNTNSSVQLNWTAPEGNFTSFRVKVVDENFQLLLSEEVDQNKNGVLVKELPNGSKMILSVTVVVNYTTSPDYTALAWEGDEKTIVTYTAPGPISNLTMSTDESSIDARWSGPEGNYSSFIIEHTLDGVTVTQNTTKTMLKITELKNSAHYTVRVSAVSGAFTGPPVEDSIYTKPSPPTDPTAININSNSITFGWHAPANISTPIYRVRLNSTFWNYSTIADINNSTNYKFINLTSGTKYDFQVSALAGGMESNPVSCSNYTVAKKVEISLSMLCSSAQPLFCANATSREKVIQKLRAYFTNKLGESVFWNFP